MTLIIADRVKDTTTTTGTGSITLSGTAPAGYRTFSSVMSTNDTCYYSIVSTSGDWEVGLGTLTGSTTLARTRVLSSSNSNALVSFAAGTHDVFITAAADSFPRSRLYVPDTSETIIDEFTAPSLSGNWSRVDPTGTASIVTITQSNGQLSMYNDGGDASSKMHAIVNTTDFGAAMVTGDAFVCAVRLYGSGAAYTMGGIVLSDNATYGSGNQMTALHYTGASPVAVDSRVTSGWTIGSGVGTFQVPLGVQTFIRLVKLASNTWRADASPDGTSWLKGTATASLTFTPTMVGLYCSSWGTSTKGVVTFECLRRVSGIT